MFHLEGGLKHSLHQSLIRHPGTHTFTDLVDLLQNMDSHQRDLRDSDHHHCQNQPTTRPGPPSAPAAASSKWPHTHGPLLQPQRPPHPKEIDHRYRQGLCTYCRGTGPLAQACPNSCQPQQQRSAGGPCYPMQGALATVQNEVDLGNKESLRETTDPRKYPPLASW